jgi:hypothetical protein
MGQDHAGDEHGAEEQRLALVAPSGDVGERNGDRGKRNRIEAKKKSGQKRDTRGGEPGMFHRLAKRVRVHHALVLVRFTKASRSCATVGIDVKTSSPSTTMDGSVSTPSSTA